VANKFALQSANAAASGMRGRVRGKSPRRGRPYLELAQRMNLSLATLDQELLTASAALGVPLLGLS
jgi:hypothetical protein